VRLKKWNKSDAALVTEADLMSEKEIIRIINRANLNCPILSEEDTSNFIFPKDNKFWAVDPLCGTVPFSCGLDSWGLSVAYLSKSKSSSVGAIYCPNTGETISCDENSVYINEEKLLVSPKFPKLKDMTLCLEIEDGINWVNLFRKDLEWIKHFSYLNSFASAVYPGSQIILGRIPVMVMYRISLEHIAALITIGEKMGLCATDLRGDDLDIADFDQKIPDWFVFGWPEPHNELINKIKER